MPIRKLESTLRDGLEQLLLQLDDQKIRLLLEYLALLEKWNKAYNLTAIRDQQQMLQLHLLDSLSIAALVNGERIIDVGTGPGLPGIPLAIIYPERQVSLLDSNGKKIRFLFQVKTALGLANVKEIQCRVESYQPEQLFDAVTSRAFTSLVDMAEKCEHLLTPRGHFYAMKGQYPTEELSALPKKYKVIDSHVLQVPGVDAERHLIDILKTPAADTEVL